MNILKICEKCGHRRVVKPRERRCKQMERNVMGRTGDWCYGRLRPMPLTAVRKPTVVDKLAHVQRKLRQAETRIKRAETIMKKWKQKVRYYLKQNAPKPRKRFAVIPEEA